jgi:hypothetical protein
MRSHVIAAILGIGTLPMLAAATPIQGVMPGDSATMSLVMMTSGTASPQAINMLGEGQIIRGNTFTDLGANRNGGGHIQASWDEVVSGGQVYITAIFRTSDGSQFMPATAQINGEPAIFWTWHLGMQDPINFQNWVTNVTVNSAHVSLSDSGGQSFTSTIDFSSNFTQNWNPGHDQGIELAMIGDGTNYMMLQYGISVIPAPAGLGALAGAGLLALRRRRR